MNKYDQNHHQIFTQALDIVKESQIKQIGYRKQDWLFIYSHKLFISMIGQSMWNICSSFQG